MTDLIAKLKEYLKKINADALLVNSTNKFLVEYNQIENNSRYDVTGFSGSTGDVLFTKDGIYQFVDGRYHEQADLEVDHSFIKVVKLQFGQKYIEEILKRLKTDSVIAIISSKVSQIFYENLKNSAVSKNIQVKLIEYDPVELIQDKQEIDTLNQIINVPMEIAGKTVDEKFSMLSDTLKEDEIFIVTSLEDTSYFTNLRSFDIPYSSYFYGKLVIAKESGILFTDSQVKNIGKKYTIKPLNDFRSRLSQLKNKKLFIDKSTISADDFSLLDSSNTILSSNASSCKTTKNCNEINHMKKAFKAADKALNIIQNMINEEKEYSEADYYEALVKSFYANGASALSFKPIVAGGKNSSIIHYSQPSKYIFVKNGDFLLVDCGIYLDGGYATDITRTFFKGIPNQEQKKVYTTVLKAFFNAFKSEYTKDSFWFDVDKAARDVIDSIDNKGYVFPHSTGHGVGISVHESPPYVSSSDISKTKIEKNKVFTIEPGIYKENTGGVRLENTVYVKDITDKIILESLSHFPFDEKMIDYSMLDNNEKIRLKEWQEYHYE